MNKLPRSTRTYGKRGSLGQIKPTMYLHDEKTIMKTTNPEINQKINLKTKPKRENIFVNILCNILIPSVILMKLSKPEYLGPLYSLVVALCFPLGYGLYDLIKSRKWNFFSAVGIFNVSLTGGFSLMQLDGFWFAVKGATEPLLFAVATLVSLKTRYPLVKTLLLNPGVMHVELIYERVRQLGVENEFAQLLKKCTYMVAGSFLLSMVTHFVLAVSVLKSPPGTPEFNRELGLMTTLGFPVNALPAMIVLGLALWFLFSGLKKLTSLDFADIMIDHETNPAEKKAKEKSVS